MLWIALVSLLVGESLAQLPSQRACPNRQPVARFNVNKFVGRWYEQKAVTSFNPGCVIIDFTLNSDKSVGIRRQQYSVNGTSDLVGKLKFPESTRVGEYIVQYSKVKADVNPTYLVLGTDYDNWALITACVDFPLYSLRFAWISTRKQNPSKDIIKKALKVAAEKDVRVEFFVDLEPQRCPADC